MKVLMGFCAFLLVVMGVAALGHSAPAPTASAPAAAPAATDAPDTSASAVVAWADANPTEVTGDCTAMHNALGYVTADKVLRTIEQAWDSNGGPANFGFSADQMVGVESTRCLTAQEAAWMLVAVSNSAHA